MRYFLLAIMAALISGSMIQSVLAADNIDQNTQKQSESSFSEEVSLLERGRYIAIAADCLACHNSEQGLMAGGLSISSPMGKIYASNITPDKETGIGLWTEKQFADALRKGTSPHLGYLYPVMPYTAYNGMKTEDIHALYIYLMKNIPAVHHKVPQTRLLFPFYRIVMPFWNGLYNVPYQIKTIAHSEQIEHGRYLVDHLAHCSTCHTPRNGLMAEKTSAYLGGGKVGSWEAPNITPSSFGIGGWSSQDIRAFLINGHNQYSAAAGEMGLAVEKSLSRLSDTDIEAIVAYLRAIPPYNESAHRSTNPPRKPIFINKLEQIPEDDFSGNYILDGARLYQGGCASCHGSYGQGSQKHSDQDIEHSSLLTNDTVRAFSPANLINVIEYGVHFQGKDREHAMPGFRKQFSDKQIAALTNYVRIQFGGQKSDVTETDVRMLSIGQYNDYFIIRYAKIFLVLALMCIASLSFFIIRYTYNKRR